MKQVSQAKDSRIDLRVTKEQKALLEKAAFLKGISLSAYTLSHLLLIAKQEIEEQEKLIMSDHDRNLFMAALENSPVLYRLRSKSGGCHNMNLFPFKSNHFHYFCP